MNFADCNKPFFLPFLAAATLLCASPVAVSPWQLTGESLQPAIWQIANPSSPLQNMTPGELRLDNESVTLASPFDTWHSPAGWRVKQAAWTDLNHDGNPEATLLVRRPFEPWPVDRLLPHGGRIQSHQDSQGISSHIILIGWKKDHWGEVWAGSALARPVQQFDAVDLNGDGRQELVVVEGSYKTVNIQPARSLAVWKWDGFGFELVSRIEKPVYRFVISKINQNQKIILVEQ